MNYQRVKMEIGGMLRDSCSTPGEFLARSSCLTNTCSHCCAGCCHHHHSDKDQRCEERQTKCFE